MLKLLLQLINLYFLLLFSHYYVMIWKPLRFSVFIKCSYILVRFILYIYYFVTLIDISSRAVAPMKILVLRNESAFLESYLEAAISLR